MDVIGGQFPYTILSSTVDDNERCDGHVLEFNDRCLVFLSSFQ